MPRGLTAHRRAIATAIAAAAFTPVLLLSGCAASSATQPPASTGSASAESVSGTVTVFAAASLTSSFTALGKAFESAHPGAKVSFSFAGSSDLVSQLTEGAPADVFASADEATMAKAVTAKLADGKPVDFATNALAIAVPPGNPAKITGFADLAKPGVRTVVCAPQVPCGAATAKVEASSGVTLTPVSQASSVTDVLGTVESGEADAGIVYVTDVKGAGAKVASVAFPEAADVINTYPIVAVNGAPNPEGAAAFVDFVTGGKGRAVLTAAGFGAP